MKKIITISIMSVAIPLFIASVSPAFAQGNTSCGNIRFGDKDSINRNLCLPDSSRQGIQSRRHQRPNGEIRMQQRQRQKSNIGIRGQQRQGPLLDIMRQSRGNRGR